MTLASAVDASPTTMERCGDFKVKLVVKHTFLQLAPSETGAADVDATAAPSCALRRISSDNMIDYKCYGDDSEDGSVRCSLASLDTAANSELVSDLQSIAWEPAASSSSSDHSSVPATPRASSSDHMSNSGNELWCDLNTDDEGEITSVAEPAPVVDQQGIWQQGSQECCPMFYFTPMSGEQQAMALKAQASQFMAQAKQAEEAAQLARSAVEASLRTAGQHAKRTKRRAAKKQHKSLQQQSPEQQHCPQSELPDSTLASFPPLTATVSKSCSVTPSAEAAKPTKLHDHLLRCNKELTTIMLRNMPTDLTRDMLVELLDSYGLQGCYNFVYLPFHLLRLTGLGHAFVDFATSFDAKRAKTALEGFSSWPVTSAQDKVCEVSWANSLQGLSAHIEFYRNSPVMHETVPEEYKPILLEGGIRQPFPFPTKQIQPPRVKCGGFVVASLTAPLPKN